MYRKERAEEVRNRLVMAGKPWKTGKRRCGAWKGKGRGGLVYDYKKEEDRGNGEMT